MNASVPRVVVVTRASDYRALLSQHGTREAARFFLERRGQDIGEAEARDRKLDAALDVVRSAIPAAWRTSHVDRADLCRFVFEPDDLVVAVGQDGLVANTAKYLSGQLVVGVNPDPARYDGVLVPCSPRAAVRLVRRAATGEVDFDLRAMVEVGLDDGQRIVALNEVFLGHRTHQSARYLLEVEGRSERQSSSGIVVSTGTGATGWARSIQRDRTASPPLPKPMEDRLVFFVREAFPSIASGTSITSGLLAESDGLVVTSEMNDGGTIFGDGIEDDRLDFRWGLRATVTLSHRKLRLLRP